MNPTQIYKGILRIKDVARKIVGKPEFRTLTALTKRFELI